ncbi:hypothetical protein EDD22DRAFT_956716 [Suillus occidentalis]|nr:hypothetical protein EDD22DRAFT_956716 [Suillus occidentalis]
MDNQIFEFEGEREVEWQVDHILSHKGAKEDAIFEVRWTAGDITWLTYEQVADLEVLVAGHGTLPQNDPRIDVRLVSLGEKSISPPSKSPAPSSTNQHPHPSHSWFDNNDIPLYAMSITPDNGHLLYFSGHGKDILVGNPENDEDSHLITCEQLKLYIAVLSCPAQQGSQLPSPLPLGLRVLRPRL